MCHIVRPSCLETWRRQQAWHTSFGECGGMAKWWYPVVSGRLSEMTEARCRGLSHRSVKLVDLSGGQHIREMCSFRVTIVQAHQGVLFAVLTLSHAHSLPTGTAICIRKMLQSRQSQATGHPETPERQLRGTVQARKLIKIFDSYACRTSHRNGTHDVLRVSHLRPSKKSVRCDGLRVQSLENMLQDHE